MSKVQKNRNTNCWIFTGFFIPYVNKEQRAKIKQIKEKYANKSDKELRKPNEEEITLVGKFLRKTHIDELPQVWNIFLGQMSFIGPRPEKPELVGKLSEEIPFYEMRHLIKPGIAGWAQLHNPHAGPTFKETLEKLQYDLYYVKNRSIFLDVSIIFKTVKIMLSGAGK